MPTDTITQNKQKSNPPLKPGLVALYGVWHMGQQKDRLK